MIHEEGALTFIEDIDRETGVKVVTGITPSFNHPTKRV